MALNYTEQTLILVFAIIGCVSVFGFASLVGTYLGIGSSAVSLKICGITSLIKKYQ